MNNPSDRQKFIELINEAHAAGAGLSACCKTLGIDFKSYQRWSLSPDREDQRTKAARAKAPPRAPSRRALSAEERAAIVDRYCQADVVDLSLTQAYYTILDKGEYYGSLRTVYRVMSAAQLNAPRDLTKARRASRRPTTHQATGPGQVWTWDITYFRNACATGAFFYGYALVDIFTRQLVHYSVYEADNEVNAKEFLEKAFRIKGIKPRQLVLHSDNGAAMKSAGTLGVLAAYSVEPSRSRPRVSNDNPYSESFFRTLKYTGRHLYPAGGFTSLQEAREWLEDYANDYNGCRYHSGINYVTPNARASGEEVEILAKRKKVLEAARANHPERWIQGKTMNCQPSGSVWLNPEKTSVTTEDVPHE